MAQSFVIGIDFGTDSVRALVVKTDDGTEVSSAVCPYPRWSKGLFCDASENRFRQHPLDYIESLSSVVNDAIRQAPSGTAEAVVGIGIDTTGSTPVAVNQEGIPLALLPGFEDNPNAMFVLWKDHTAVLEAEEINAAARRSEIDYTKFTGGVYSSEWFWAKILHILRHDRNVAEKAYSWVEHCDWIPFLLTGGNDVRTLKRSRCAAGHKALWHPEFEGLPPDAFWSSVDPLLQGLRERLFSNTFTSEKKAGTLSAAWSIRLGLPVNTVVAVGAFDAHMGAVGGQIEPYHLSKVMGTSTCDMLVAPVDEVSETLVAGICGQVEGSIIPDMLGLEAGQSAFGDLFAWFRSILFWPMERIIDRADFLRPDQKEKLLIEGFERLIPLLSEAASDIDPDESGIVAIDWLNGRRTPDANQELKGAMTGLHLGSDAPRLFRALVEAACFGARAIVDRFLREGIRIDGVIGLGGVAKKAPFVMQTMADVLKQPIRIVRSEQTCALGAAMFAAVAAGEFESVKTARDAMGSGFDAVYYPNAANSDVYDLLYQKYVDVSRAVEGLTIQSTANA